jgi:hypothetical protein
MTDNKPTAVLIIATNKTASQNYAAEKIRFAICSSTRLATCSCQACQSLHARKGSGFAWFTPAGFFDTQTADEILKITALKNSSSQDFFIVVEQVEKMPRACANRILKVLEEPSPGYKFIFTTQNSSQVVDTIKSRCFMVNLASTPHQQLLGQIGTIILTNPSAHEFESFFNLVDEVAPEQAAIEQEFELIRELATREFLTAKASPGTDDSSRLIFLEKLIATCDQFAAVPAQPGGGKLFCKAFFVQLVL